MNKIELKVLRMSTLNALHAAVEYVEEMFANKNVTLSEKKLFCHSMAQRDDNPIGVLANILSKDNSLNALFEGWLAIERVISQVPASMIAFALTYAALTGNDESDSIEKIKAFAATGISSFDVYIPIVGATTVDNVTLYGGWQLLPWGHVPNGSYKKAFEPLNTIFSDDFPFGYRSEPTPDAALFHPGGIRQVLFKTTGDVDHRPLSNPVRFADESAEICFCLTALTERVVTPLGMWFHEHDTFIGLCVPPALSRFKFQFDTRPGRPYIFQHHDATQARDLISNYHGMKDGDRATMNTVLERLQRAMWPYSLVDMAIDLGVALEVLLLHGIEDVTSDLAFQIAARATVLAGGDSANRRRTFDLIKRIYNARSRAVHNGQFEARRNGGIHADLMLGISLCLSLCHTILSDGLFPDWDKILLNMDPR